MLFRSNDTATTEIYTRLYTLSLHDAFRPPTPAASKAYFFFVAFFLAAFFLVAIVWYSTSG